MMLQFLAVPAVGCHQRLARDWRRRSTALATSSLVVLMTLVLYAPTVHAESSDRPNIVLIMADDLGYGELGCYGQEKIRTPSIDQLANAGMRFTQHYSGAPVCAPSRCVLLSGQHLGHAEVRGNRPSGNGRVFPGQWPITSELVTIAEVLKKAGYATGAFGKWGLGPSNTSGSPIKQGFDRYYGYNCQRNAHSYYPLFLDSNEREQRINKYPIPGHDRQPDGEVRAEDYRSENYGPDLILEQAVRFLDEHHDEPFFLYLPFIEPHVAMQPPQEWVDRYPESWDEKTGAYRGQNGYLPHPRPRAGYAAMISDLDEHVGTIMDRLQHHELVDNTIVIFLSDNGPTHPSRDERWHVGGAACTFFNSTGGLRGYKGSCYEGGLRTPCIVKWPGTVAPGSTSDFPSYFPDWFPTLAAISQADLPADQVLDGVDLTGILRGERAPGERPPMIWDFRGYGGIAAIRDGDWKAVRRDLFRDEPQPWELYNLANDPQETTDLADTHPEIVERLEATYVENRWAEPDFPNPLYDSQSSSKK